MEDSTPYIKIKVVYKEEIVEDHDEKLKYPYAFWSYSFLHLLKQCVAGYSLVCFVVLSTERSIKPINTYVVILTLGTPNPCNRRYLLHVPLCLSLIQAIALKLDIHNPLCKKIPSACTILFAECLHFYWELFFWGGGEGFSWMTSIKVESRYYLRCNNESQWPQSLWTLSDIVLFLTYTVGSSNQQ